MSGQAQAQDTQPPGAAQPCLSVIVAMAKNGVIGAGGRIPWHLPDELQLFKRVTLGHTIVMGRKTFESIGRLLPGRKTVIVTRQRDYAVPGALVAHSVCEAVASCAGQSEIFVIGGAELYRETLPVAKRLYLTTVDAEPEGDTFMPELDWDQWCETRSEAHPADERHAHAWRFALHERRR